MTLLGVASPSNTLHRLRAVTGPYLVLPVDASALVRPALVLQQSCTASLLHFDLLRSTQTVT